MALLADLRRAAGELLRSRNSAVSSDEACVTAGGGGCGFSSLPGEESLGSMTAEELSAWENRDVPSIDRAADDSEARADEKQDVTTSLTPGCGTTRWSRA